MSTYTPHRFDIPTGFDETGIMLGLNRLRGESLPDYRRRLLLEARDRSGPTQDQFIKSIGRKVGEFDVPVFEVDVIRDANDIPLAADPYIEITSTYLRAYSDWENNTLDFEHNLVDRSDAYFLREIYTAFNSSTYFDITVLDASFTYKRSRNLRLDNTERFVRAEFLAESRSNKLDHDYVREIYPQAFQHFETEVSSKAAVDDDGKYYVDYLNGVIFTYEYATGILAYKYREFPFRLWWQPVRSWPYSDEDKTYRFKDSLISDTTGQTSPLLLNSEGAQIVNTVIAAHPLGWGE